MAGAKETPRQKMIGMMYLVLTALLALNVSKSILDAFVAIEANIQESNLTEYFRGNEKKAEIAESASDSSDLARAKKAKMFLDIIDEIDKETAKRINEIDELKIQLLQDCGENVESSGKEGDILIDKFIKTSKNLKPVRMNLENVSAKDKYDETMHLLIGDDITNPTGKGIELWKSFNSYRKLITEKMASSQIIVNNAGNAKFDKSYFFKAPEINNYKDQKDLNDKILAAMKKSNVHPDDKDLLLDLYSSLTKKERYTVNEIKNVHWIGKTFDHAPSVAALASLSSLQKDMLSARAKAIALIRSRIGGGEYSFNKIIPLAYGPEVVNSNDEFTVEVLMAAYDSDKQPEVTYDGQQIMEIRDGKGFVKVKAGSGKMLLNGTVSIRNKSGLKKTMDWTKEVYVMKPAGSIEIPGYNLLYRGYKNIIDPTASGFPETILSGTDVTITKEGGFYVVQPRGNTKTASLTVSGKTADGKIVKLKTVTYKVATLPKPTLYWGGSIDGEPISPSNTKLNAKYTPDIPLNVAFTIIDWTYNSPNGKPIVGKGNDLSNLIPIVKILPSKASIPLTCSIKYPDGTKGKVNAIFFKQ